MLAALVQVDDRVNLSKSIFHSKTFSACSHLECLHVSNTSALLVEEAVIHPLPDVVQCFWCERFLGEPNLRRPSISASTAQSRRNCWFASYLRQITESDISVLIMSSLTTAKSTCKVLPAGHVGDITLLNGGDPLELTVIPHGLLQRHIIKVYCKETLISLILLVVQLIKDYKILTSPVLAASTTFFLNHSTGPSTVVCMNLNPRLLIMETVDKIELKDKNLSNLSSGVKLFVIQPMLPARVNIHKIKFHDSHIC